MSGTEPREAPLVVTPHALVRLARRIAGLLRRRRTDGKAPQT
jgi:hypothetical protein